MIQNLAKLIPAEGETMLLELVTRIEKHRALLDDESKLVEELIRREKRRHCQRVIRAWTHTQKADLLKAAKRRGGVKLFSAANDIPERIAWHMLRNLRNSATKQLSVKG